MITSYTPPKKNRAPCYGCKHLAKASDPGSLEYYCYAKSRRGRLINSIRLYQWNYPKDILNAILDRRIQKNMRPAWCPLLEKKKGEHKDE